MSEQQSGKQGLKSSAQKETRARNANAPLPASNPVRGAFGADESNTSDQDLSLSIEEKRNSQHRHDSED